MGSLIHACSEKRWERKIEKNIWQKINFAPTISEQPNSEENGHKQMKKV